MGRGVFLVSPLPSQKVDSQRSQILQFSPIYAYMFDYSDHIRHGNTYGVHFRGVSQSISYCTMHICVAQFASVISLQCFDTVG